MPVEHKGIDEDFDAFVDGRLSELERDVVDIFVKVGEIGYKTAVSRGSYQDRTGTLRSSIGYGVVKYGRLVKTGGFKNFRSGSAGIAEGKDLLNEKVKECGADEITLIFVAGAEYAVYVEAMGYDVITFSELETYRKAEDEISKLFK